MVLVRDEAFSNYRVGIGMFMTPESATRWVTEHVKPDESPFVRRIDDIYFVQYGSFTEYDNAIACCERLNGYGYPCIIIGKEI